jgi:hypothetical protein
LHPFDDTKDILIIDFIEGIDVNASLAASVGVTRGPDLVAPARWEAPVEPGVVTRRIIPLGWTTNPDVRVRAMDPTLGKEEIELTITNMVTASGIRFDAVWTEGAEPDSDDRDLIPILFGRPAIQELFVRWVGADGAAGLPGVPRTAHDPGTGWATDMFIMPSPSAPSGRVADMDLIGPDHYWKALRNSDDPESWTYYLRRTDARPEQTTDVDNPFRLVPEETTRIFANFSMPVQPGQGTFSLSEFFGGNQWGEMDIVGPFTLRSVLEDAANPDAFLARYGFAVGPGRPRDEAIRQLRMAWNCVCITQPGLFPVDFDCIVYIDLAPGVSLERSGLYNAHITQFRTVLAIYATDEGAAVRPADYVWLYRNNPLQAVDRVYFTHTFQAHGEPPVPPTPCELEVAQVWISTTRDFLNDFVDGNARLIYSNEDDEQRFVNSPHYGKERITLLNLHMLLDEDVIANNYLTVIFTCPVVPNWGTVEANYRNLFFTEDGRWFPVQDTVFGPNGSQVAGAPSNPLTARTWGPGFVSLGLGSFAEDLPAQNMNMVNDIDWVRAHTVSAPISRNPVPFPTSTAPQFDQARWNAAFPATTPARYGYNAVQFDLELFRVNNRHPEPIGNPGQVFTSEFFPSVELMDLQIRENNNLEAFALLPRRTYVGYTHRPYNITDANIVVVGYVCANYWRDNAQNYYREVLGVGAIWPSDAQEARWNDPNRSVALGREQYSFSIQQDPQPTVLAWGVFEQDAEEVLRRLNPANLNPSGSPNAIRRNGDVAALNLSPALIPNLGTVPARNILGTHTPGAICRWRGYGINETVTDQGLTGPGMQLRWQNRTCCNNQSGIRSNNYALPVLDLALLGANNTGSVIIWFTEVVHPAHNAIFPGTGGGGGIAGVEGIDLGFGPNATLHWFHDWRLNGDPRFIVSFVVVDLLDIRPDELPVTSGESHGIINVHEYPELVEFGTERAGGIWRAFVNDVLTPNPHARHSREVPLVFRVTESDPVDPDVVEEELEEFDTRLEEFLGENDDIPESVRVELELRMAAARAAIAAARTPAELEAALRDVPNLQDLLDELLEQYEPSGALAKAEEAVKAALGKIEATNDITAAKIISAVRDVLVDDLDAVKVEWVVEAVTVPATAGIPGSVKGTLKLEYSSYAPVQVIVDLVIPALPVPPCTDCSKSPCECPELCKDCDEYPCVCPDPCKDCDEYPCECPELCDECDEPLDDCKCCPECKVYPCECIPPGGFTTEQAQEKMDDAYEAINDFIESLGDLLPYDYTVEKFEAAVKAAVDCAYVIITIEVEIEDGQLVGQITIGFDEEKMAEDEDAPEDKVIADIAIDVDEAPEADRELKVVITPAPSLGERGYFTVTLDGAPIEGGFVLFGFNAEINMWITIGTGNTAGAPIAVLGNLTDRFAANARFIVGLSGTDGLAKVQSDLRSFPSRGPEFDNPNYGVDNGVDIFVYIP